MSATYESTPAVKEIYRGIEYASKTEARWAKLYDMLKWTHSYEPALLDGWKPDFQITADRGGSIWVEVKPLFEMFEAVRDKMEQSRVQHGPDVLAFCYREVTLDRTPSWFGRVAVWDALDGLAPGWRWWDAAVWLCAPVGRWGIAIPDLDRELVLDPETVANNGGIAI